MWPGAVVVAKFMNASPYQMLATNVGGIAWTIYNCFFTEHDDLEEHTVSQEEEFSHESAEDGKLTAGSFKQRWQ